MVALVLSLGLDTLMVAISLGLVRTGGKLKVASVIACCEALMPLIGLEAGHLLGRAVGNWASALGGVALLALAAWSIFGENEPTSRPERDLRGWTLLLTGLSVSLDELAVGFSIGLMGVPVALTVLLIAIQAFLFTFVGMTFGSRIGPHLGEWAEKLAGGVLGLLGLWILLDTALRVLR